MCASLGPIAEGGAAETHPRARAPHIYMHMPCHGCHGPRDLYDPVPDPFVCASFHHSGPIGTGSAWERSWRGVAGRPLPCDSAPESAHGQPGPEPEDVAQDGRLAHRGALGRGALADLRGRQYGAASDGGASASRRPAPRPPPTEDHLKLQHGRGGVRSSEEKGGIGISGAGDTARMFGEGLAPEFADARDGRVIEEKG